MRKTYDAIPKLSPPASCFKVSGELKSQLYHNCQHFLPPQIKTVDCGLPCSRWFSLREYHHIFIRLRHEWNTRATENSGGISPTPMRVDDKWCSFSYSRRNIQPKSNIGRIWTKIFCDLEKVTILRECGRDEPQGGDDGFDKHLRSNVQ